MSSIVISFALALSGLAPSPAGASECFTVTEDVVVNGAGCTGAIVIPDGVTAIGDEAFKESTITSVSIPASVASIGDYAFYNLQTLTSVTFAANSELTSIGTRGFGSSSSLASFTIPTGVTSIGDFAFMQTKETTVTIPASTTEIGHGAFAYMDLLTSFTFAAGSQITTIPPSMLYGSVMLASLTIPASVTSIGIFAFSELEALTSFTIPPSVTTIPEGAFRNSGLTSITIPEGVTSIGSQAFRDNTGLTSVTIPASVNSIGDYAFLDSSSITSFYFMGNSPPEQLGNGWWYGIGAQNAYVLTTATGFGTEWGEPWYGWSVFTFEAASYMVTFNSKGGSAVISDTFVAGGAIEEPPAPTFSGYTFAGWSDTDGGDVVSFPYSPEVQDDITLYAKWTPNTYTVTFNSKGGSAVNGGTFVTGGSISAPSAPTRSGYTFAGWSAVDGGLSVTFPYSPGVTRNITLYAKWTLNTGKAVSVVKPTVTGTARVGQTLTANKGTWTGNPTPTFTYQWYVCSSAVASPTQVIASACKTISGATRSTFKLLAAHKGKWVTVLVSGTSAGTTRTSWLAKSTGKVG